DPCPGPPCISWVRRRTADTNAYPVIIGLPARSPQASFGFFRDGHGLNLHRLRRLIVCPRGDAAAGLDRLQRRVVGGLADGRVVAVEGGMPAQADEELGAGGVWIARSSHGQDARLMRRGVEFGLDAVAWLAGAGAERTAPLNHEALDDPMKR